MIVVDTPQSALTSLCRITGVIHASDPRENSVPVTDGQEAKASLKNVSHRYSADAPLSLDDVSLRIHRGQKIAVVGASGAGKTTLASVLAGIHDPEEGEIRRPTRTSVITQESHVFSGTLRENLMLAAPEATDHEILEALRNTGATGLLEIFDHGLDSELAGIGHELTAAQAQQLALARVLLAVPELAILDEATSEAGSMHAGVLDRAAEALLADRAGVIIAHRLSQAANCDFIIVMEHGRIIESGTHQELLTAGASCAGLWRAWSQWDRS